MQCIKLNMALHGKSFLARTRSYTALHLPTWGTYMMISSYLFATSHAPELEVKLTHVGTVHYVEQ